jgi:hypothetical protein
MQPTTKPTTKIGPRAARSVGYAGAAPARSAPTALAALEEDAGIDPDATRAGRSEEDTRDSRFDSASATPRGTVLGRFCAPPVAWRTSRSLASGRRAFPSRGDLQIRALRFPEGDAPIGLASTPAGLVAAHAGSNTLRLCRRTADGDGLEAHGTPFGAGLRVTSPGAFISSAGTFLTSAPIGPDKNAYLLSMLRGGVPVPIAKPLVHRELLSVFFLGRDALVGLDLLHQPFVAQVRDGALVEVDLGPTPIPVRKLYGSIGPHTFLAATAKALVIIDAPPHGSPRGSAEESGPPLRVTQVPFEGGAPTAVAATARGDVVFDHLVSAPGSTQRHELVWVRKGASGYVCAGRTVDDAEVPGQSDGHAALAVRSDGTVVRAVRDDASGIVGPNGSAVLRIDAYLMPQGAEDAGVTPFEKLGSTRTTGSISRPEPWDPLFLPCGTLVVYGEVGGGDGCWLGAFAVSDAGVHSRGAPTRWRGSLAWNLKAPLDGLGVGVVHTSTTPSSLAADTPVTEAGLLCLRTGAARAR